MTYTDTDFEKLSWHDCHVWGIELRVGSPDEGDWTSDLALDIDFIVAWTCGVDGGATFRVAPATLVFHGVTDPRIAIDWGPAGYQVAPYPASIGHIERARMPEQRVYLDRAYYRWRIRLNAPADGEIAFGAVGFTQTLRAEPITTSQQSLSYTLRRRLTTPG